MRNQFSTKIKRIVIKIGSSIISSKTGKLDKVRIKQLSNQIAAIYGTGTEIIIVSSGAIACGMSEIGLTCRPDKLSCLQAAAAVGQNILMQAYIAIFKKKQLRCAQVLLTWDDFQIRSRYLNAKNTINSLIENRIIPIVNENDVVSTDEIKFGDNDRLSALVASLIDADLLILLSDVDGLYKGKHSQKEVISLVENIDGDIEKLAKDTNKRNISKGGMISKLDAAGIAIHSKIPCVIANGKTKNVILEILSGKTIGTLFTPKTSKMLAKKRWIAFGVKPTGKIVIDSGAKDALLKRNKSLLCPGIIGVDGKFHSGDIVAIVDENGKEIAKGRAGFSNEELCKIKGSRVAKEAVHRNNLAITYRGR